MSNTLSANLESTLAKGDPGDETANRYRFQWIWAAVTCCKILDSTLDVQEVFCEHHEDVLIKHIDGSFTGHQVKTRGDDQPPWKANDESVISACARFVSLDDSYSGKFRGFSFLTNHVIHSTKNSQDIIHVLSSIKSADSISDLHNSIAKWVKKVAKLACVDDEAAFKTLSKSKASAELPKLHDALMRLINTIAQCWPPAKELSHGAVVRAAQELVNECTRASSLDHVQLLPAYVAESGNDEDDVIAAIDGKRMTFSRIQRVLESGRDSYSELIGDPSKIIQPGGGSTELLHQKLDAGAFLWLQGTRQMTYVIRPIILE
ncbi:dsDNA nuclease domain-containing protein [Halomonas sp. LY9]